jgi:hypothetical protein
MKFFTEKRLYSQHFHSLRLKGHKQDVAFRGKRASSHSGGVSLMHARMQRLRRT